MNTKSEMEGTDFTDAYQEKRDTEAVEGDSFVWQHDYWSDSHPPVS